MPRVGRTAMTLASVVALFAACGESERLIGTVGNPSMGNVDAASTSDAAQEAGVGILALLPLRTDSRWIVDAQGNRFTFSSVVWYGAESPDLVPYGLDHNSIADLANLVRQLGFNSVRVPWCNEMLESNPLIDASLLTANPDLMGKTALQIFDAVIDSLTARGLLVILDNHRSKGEWCCDVAHGDGLWHTPEYPESSWISDWQALVTRYQTNPLVVGADVRDAPRSQLSASAPASCTDCSATCPCDVATWGGGDPTTDWPAAAERAGNAILAINPNLLIMVEGIDSSRTIPANARPILLNVANRLVYSPHDYPYTYNGIATFTTYDEFKATLEQEWGYLVTEGQAYTGPVWTVFGANHGGTDAQFWGWMRQYVTEKNVSWAYWAINGTEGHGYSRDFGAEEIYGVLNVNWNGTANVDHLSEIQSLPR
jgi:endoglucanase